MPRPIRVEATLTLPFTPAQLWPFVTDTNRMDHVVGLPPGIFVRRRRGEGGETIIGEYRVRSRTVARWIEHPFEWERPQRYSILREYEVGPVVRYLGGVHLRATADGTLLHVFTELTPRHWLVGPLVRLGVAPVTLRRACRQYRAIAAYLAGAAADPFPTLAPAPGVVNTARLEALLARLGDDSPTVVEQLRRLLREGADEDVAGIRPLAWARRWGTEPRQTLAICLRAAEVGLLEMQWELLCPGCRGVKATADRLRDLAARGYCPACNRPVAGDIDEAIEARFYPAPAVRALAVGTYCIGSPMTTPHRVAQAQLAPGAERVWQLVLAPGPYQLSSPQSRGVAQLDAAPDGLPEVKACIDPSAVTLTGERVAAAAAVIRLRNTATTPVTVALDEMHWSADGATPGRLMMLPAFRTLFSAEALAPGVELVVGRVGLLFTDLAGSTALYERAGEARAFRLVTEHFAIVQRAVESAGGAVVKTIGDAVMAAFPDGAAAVAAGLTIQRAIRDLDLGGLADACRLVKVGVHAGACFLVTLNERLDYFGTAVNLAARAQHEAGGGEVVATAAAFDEALTAVAAAGLAGEPFEVVLRGLAAPVRLYRIDCSMMT